MPAVVNLSAYKFTPLTELPALQTRIRAVATEAGLKGTVLLATEGINLFVAGSRAGTDAFVAALRREPGLADLTPKESPSDAQPFGRLFVKIKKEIIAFGVDGLDPARMPAPRLAPGTLKAWLDAGRPVTLLDTRNDYEVAAGTFRGALDPRIKRFRDFPAALRTLPPELKQQPVVTFCTGGIRCEKAAPLLQREGWTEVYQLDGGILKYFEHCGSAHFDGTCFVFDERQTVDGSLAPAPATATAPTSVPAPAAP